MDRCLLDSDILSELIKGRNPQVAAAARAYMAVYSRLAFSEFTIYEITRGLLSKRSANLLHDFQLHVSRSDVYPVSRAVLVRAAELWK